MTNQNPELFHLTFREFECEQFHSRFVTIGRAANDAQKFVEIRQRNEITFQRFCALFRLAQFETRAAQDDFAAMLDISGVCFLEWEQLGSAVVIASIVTANE